MIKQLMKIIFVLALSISLTAFRFETDPLQSSNLNSILYSSELWGNIIGAIIGGLLGFIFSYIIFRIQLKRSSKMELSFDTNFKRELVSFEPSIKDNIAFKYKELPADELHYFSLDIENTGYKVVKNEYIRIKFDENLNSIDTYFEPIPEKEYFVQEVNENLANFERQFKIGHLEKGIKIGFRFILIGIQKDEPILHFYNELGDIKVTKRSIKKNKDDKEYVQEFLFILFIHILFPLIFLALPYNDSITTFAINFTRGITALLLLGFVRRVSKILIAWVNNFLNPNVNKPSIQIISNKDSKINIKTFNE